MKLLLFIYYLFIKCIGCGDMLGNNSEIVINVGGVVPQNCQSFLDMINRGGLVKPSDIVYVVCTVAWDVYVRIMESCEAKLYFLACKMQRKVFVNLVVAEITDNDDYGGILETSCIKNHAFSVMLDKLVVKFFNVMCKNFVSEINSAVHKSKKRSKRNEINWAALGVDLFSLGGSSLLQTIRICNNIIAFLCKYKVYTCTNF